MHLTREFILRVQHSMFYFPFSWEKKKKEGRKYLNAHLEFMVMHKNV